MVTPRRTYSNVDSTDDDLIFQTPVPQRSDSRRSKKQVENPAAEVMKEATSVLKSLSQRNQVKENLPPPQQPMTPGKSSDEFFGETIGKLMAEIPDGMNKDMLKLEMQNLIYKTKYCPTYGTYQPTTYFQALFQPVVLIFLLSQLHRIMESNDANMVKT